MATLGINLKAECDICHDTKADWYVDGKTSFGPWGMMCPKCFIRHGRGLGTGLGQKYDAKTGKKIEG